MSGEPAASARGQAEQDGLNRHKPAAAGSRRIAKLGIDYRQGRNLLRAAQVGRYTRQPADPLYRPLRVYMADPVESGYTGRIAVILAPYEQLEPGPRGAFLEVVAPATMHEVAVDGVDLDLPTIAMSQGLRPSAADPQFHQQMVYAVCADVAAAFTIALGREPSWGFDGPRLKIYPHDGEERNAYYDAAAGALRFGYFKADPKPGPGILPSATIYTCLSHDIIAHEMTHALLDGMRARFSEPTNPDVLAFHEGFADLVAILQHFSYADAVRDAVARSHGKLGEDVTIFSLAEQFGEATGAKGPMRVGLGKPGSPSPTYGESDEPHERGSVLVVAVMEALSHVFERRAAPIKTLQAATPMAGGALHPAALDLLSDLASKVASQFLSLCIRAIDYCPPVDVRFGDYLRALITADHELVEDDKYKFRQEIIAAFTQHGIYPDATLDISEESLIWNPPQIVLPKIRGLSLSALQLSSDPGRAPHPAEIAREAGALADIVTDPLYMREFGLTSHPDFETPVIESVRILRRIGPDRQVMFGIVCEVIQSGQMMVDGSLVNIVGGSTLILDGDGAFRFVIRKGADNPKRAAAMRDFAASQQFRDLGQLVAQDGGRSLWAAIHACCR